MGPDGRQVLLGGVIVRIVEKSVKCWYNNATSTAGSTFNQAYSFAASLNPASVSGPSRINIVASKPSQWTGYDPDDQYRITWNVMDDGSMVSCDDPGRKGTYQDSDPIPREEYSDYISGTTTRNGMSYTPKLMTAGKLIATSISNFDIVMGEEAGDEDLFYKYVVRSDDPTVSTWGSTPTVGPSFTDDYRVGVYRTIPGDSGADNDGLYAHYISRKDGSGSAFVKVGSGYEQEEYVYRLVMVPDHHYAYIDQHVSNIGNKTKEFSFSFTPMYEDQETIASVSGNIGSVQAFSYIDVASNQQFAATVPQSVFDQLPPGENTLTLTLTTEEGLSRSYDVAFYKKYVHITLESCAQSLKRMPVGCSLVNAVVLGQGATEQWWVCNNANDASPTWEEYTGDGHAFANSQKTAADWGVAWKCKIGGASATTQSELLKQVAMGVSYEAV